MKKLFGFIPFILLLFFFTSCSQSNDEAVKTLVKKYVDVWNGGSLDSLDTITSEDFELRMNPKFEPLKGREKLKEGVTKTRYAFPDFMVDKKEMIFLGDTAIAVSWTISGTYKNPQDSLGYGNKTEAEGFSIIFFNEGVLTGEWIGYSDLEWYKGMGYELQFAKKK
jgi:hypothetical protein